MRAAYWIGYAIGFAIRFMRPEPLDLGSILSHRPDPVRGVRDTIAFPESEHEHFERWENQMSIQDGES